MESNYFIHYLIELTKILIPLVAVYLVYRFGIKQIINQKRLEFVDRQLREFYSPMISYRNTIITIRELQENIFKATDIKWKEFCEINPKPTDQDFRKYDNSLKFDKKQFREEIITLYDKMVSIFNENYYLAEKETRNYFNELYCYVNIWHRWLEDSIPYEVAIELKYSEESLIPFYNDLDKQEKILTKKLSFKK